MQKAKYYNMLSQYEDVGHIAWELIEDDGFRRHKNLLIKEIRRLIMACNCILIEKETRRYGDFMMSRIEQENEYEISNRLRALIKKIENNEPIMEADYKGTYVRMRVFGIL